MQRNPFTFLRLATCIGLLALLAGRILINGPTINLMLFLLLVLFWFIPTLLLNRAYAKTPRAHMLTNTLFAVLDAYVLLMATAEVASDIWSKPFLLLGAYAFLASLLGGPVAGAGGAISGFCGLLNGWLTPLGELQESMLLGGVAAAGGGLVCGSAWRLILPRVIRTAQQQNAPESATEPTVDPQQTLLNDMEARLREITAERDHTLESLQQLQAPQPAAVTPPVEETPAIEHPPKAKPPASTNPTVTPQAYLQQMETELASLQAEKTALEAEKDQLVSESARLSDELMAAFLPPV